MNINNKLLQKKILTGNEKIDQFIQEKKLKVNNPNSIIFEWIQYNRFDEMRKIGRGGFSEVYLAIWKDGPLRFNDIKKEWERISHLKVALKCLNSQNVDEFLNEAKNYSLNFNSNNVLKIYGISQNPDTKDYIMVLEYANKGNLNDWTKDNYRDFDWNDKLKVLGNIIDGLNEIHQNQIVHCDLHTGNILYHDDSVYISDMGLCMEVGGMNENIYGVMPYVAPEVLRGKPYIPAADIYSFGMIMYFVATGRQPFALCAHDERLAIKICEGFRPETNELGMPKCYVDLMKWCWNPNPNLRPHASDLKEWIEIFNNPFRYGVKFEEFVNQFKEAEYYRTHENIVRQPHNPSAVYTSRILSHTECLSCAVK